MESAHPVRGVEHDSASGRLFNPGHSIEVAWFVLRLCRLCADPELEAIALAALEGSLCAVGPPQPHRNRSATELLLRAPARPSGHSPSRGLWLRPPARRFTGAGERGRHFSPRAGRELGWDGAHGGGLLYMLDVLGKPLADTTVTAEHKLWWPHTEALIACAIALEHTGDLKWLAWLRRVHGYIYAHFCDESGGGEWFGYLRRDGSVYNQCKGGN